MRFLKSARRLTNALPLVNQSRNRAVTEVLALPCQKSPHALAEKCNQIDTAKKRKTCWLRRALLPCHSVFEVDWTASANEIAQQLHEVRPFQIMAAMKKKFRVELSKRVHDAAQRHGKLCYMFQIFPYPIEGIFIRRLPRHLATPVLRLLTSGHHFWTETGRWEHIPQEE